MTEPLLPAFPPPAGLTMVGAEDAAVCVDGVCAVPAPPEEPVGPAPREDAAPTR
ncbi:hypothetical protein M3148_01415 [Georgenia satyanarayanai]|uniref:hypothetical protein n=1 Tax=Georgenia satyanarayanai TaxID=860221 RepID=UPI00203C84E1|nr:hypothetical protein [Georgenia satyanarayanai]MCM3659657.1 hypothetical protein [Georgenia satyanarayanai]